MDSQDKAKHAAKRRSEIIIAASRVFDAKGYAATTMDAVAAEAKVAKGSLYNYFPSKEDMLFSIQTYCFQAVLDGLDRRLAIAESSHERLRAFIHNHLNFFINNVREMRVLSHESALCRST